jgi:hypothetical protein
MTFGYLQLFIYSEGFTHLTVSHAYPHYTPPSWRSFDVELNVSSLWMFDTAMVSIVQNNNHVAPGHNHVQTH